MEGKISQIDVEGGMSACDYLYTVWRVLLSEHIYKNGSIGEVEIISLMPKYMDKKEQDITNKLMKVYRNSISKHAQFFKISELNSFLTAKVTYLNSVLEEMEPEKKFVYQVRIEEIKKHIEYL